MLYEIVCDGAHMRSSRRKISSKYPRRVVYGNVKLQCGSEKVTGRKKKGNNNVDKCNAKFGSDGPETRYER